MRSVALALLVLLVAPAGALGAQWHVRTVATGGPALLLASDARGDRRLVVVDERERGNTHVLELRIGQSRRTLATGRHGFEGVNVGHDGRDRVTYELPAGATAFGAAQTLSQAAFTGVPALVARGETVFIGWTEGDLGRTATKLRAVRWGETLSAPSTYDTGHALGSPRATLRAQALPGTAARFYYRTVGKTTRWFTVWFDALGRAHGAARVTPPGERGALDLAGQPAGSGSVAVWTASLRIRIATP